MVTLRVSCPPVCVSAALTNHSDAHRDPGRKGANTGSGERKEKQM